MGFKELMPPHAAYRLFLGGCWAYKCKKLMRSADNVRNSGDRYSGFRLILVSLNNK